MAGAEHILFTDRDGENFLAVKAALRPYLNRPLPSLHRISLVLRREDGSYEDEEVEDERPVPLNGQDVNLELLVKDITMNAAQQALIEEWTRRTNRLTMRMNHPNRYYVLVLDTDINTPDKMEAFLFYLENNPSIELLEMRGVAIHQIIPIMMSIISKNIPLERLIISTTSGSADEMQEFLQTIGQINTLHTLNLSSIQGNLTYRHQEVGDLLRQNTSLRSGYIYEYNIF
jgi:hypothetical protein